MFSKIKNASTYFNKKITENNLILIVELLKF